MPTQPWVTPRVATPLSHALRSLCPLTRIEAARLDDPLHTERRYGVSKRGVDRGQRGPKGLGGGHHDRTADAAEGRAGRQLGQELGVAGKVEARLVERLFGYRRRHHAADGP